MRDEITDRLIDIRLRIDRAAEKSGRSGSDVTLVAVSKTVTADRVRAAIHAGQHVFGENRVQEGVRKIRELGDDATNVDWHLIGHLQSNKVKSAVESFGLIESIDTVRLAAKIDETGEGLRRCVPILLEVNAAAEPSKTGFSVDDVRGSMSQLLSLQHVDIRGFMTIAPLTDNAENVRWVFRIIRNVRDEMCRLHDVKLPELSMGMSADFEVAVEEGATIVRLGRGLFGDRPPARKL